MAHWENYFGCEFGTQEDAYEDAAMSQEWDDIEEYFMENVSFHKLFEYARQTPNFFDVFENELCESTQDFFRSNYYEVEDSEEDNVEEE